MHAHAEQEVDLRREGCRGLDGSVGVEGDAHAEVELPGSRDRGRHVVTHLDVEGDAVAARLPDLLEVALGLHDHQVAVDPATGLVDGRRDRLHHDRADRDRRDELPVADVDVEDAARRRARSASIWSPRRMKSAAYSDGAISTPRVQSFQVTAANRTAA